MIVDRREFLGGLLALSVGGPRLLFAVGEGSRMYGLIGSMEAAAGRRDELIGILVEAARSMPGCLSYVVAADPANATTVWVTEVWESQESHEASLSLPAVRDAIAAGRPLIAGFGRRTITEPAGGHGLGPAEPEPNAAERDPVAPVEDRVVEVSALVPVSTGDAFRYFTDPDLLTRWLAPVAEVDAVAGGRYELFWAPDDRENNSTIGCRITALAPGQCLAFQWRSPVQFKHFANGADPLTHVVVVFHPEATGTRVRLIHSGWRSDARWEEARVWQERAWQVAFEALERVVQPDR